MFIVFDFYISVLLIPSQSDNRSNSFMHVYSPEDSLQYANATVEIRYFVYIYILR